PTRNRRRRFWARAYSSLWLASTAASSSRARARLSIAERKFAAMAYWSSGSGGSAAASAVGEALGAAPGASASADAAALAAWGVTGFAAAAGAVAAGPLAGGAALAGGGGAEAGGGSAPALPERSQA